MVVKFKNTTQFKLDLKKFGEQSEETFEKVFRKIALDIDSSVILGTPVDTGRARGNWFTTIGNPSSAVSAGGSAGKAMGQLNAAVAQLKLGDTIWMANNLPYINRLENGWSKQAPAGMVAINVARFKSKYGS